MEEFRLDEAVLQEEGLHIAFKRNRTQTVQVDTSERQVVHQEDAYESAIAPAPVAPTGTPITSPMTGVFYSTPGPGQSAFITEGATVTTGQVLGLIEAMKVFNEIPSPTSGVIKKIVAENGAVVNPGDVLLFLA